MERIDKTISFPVKDSMYQQVIEFAKKKDIRISEAMRVIVKNFFNQQKKQAA